MDRPGSEKLHFYCYSFQARSRVMFKLQELIKANMDTLAVSKHRSR